MIFFLLIGCFQLFYCSIFLKLSLALKLFWNLIRYFRNRAVSIIVQCLDTMRQTSVLWFSCPTELQKLFSLLFQYVCLWSDYCLSVSHIFSVRLSVCLSVYSLSLSLTSYLSASPLSLLPVWVLWNGEWCSQVMFLKHLSVVKALKWYVEKYSNSNPIQEYYSLRDEWKERFAGGSTTEEVKYVASMVKKDVLRTDRSHRLYAGGDDNKNVLSLFHILVTYALTHPDVSYCQVSQFFFMFSLSVAIVVLETNKWQRWNTSKFTCLHAVSSCRSSYYTVFCVFLCVFIVVSVCVRRCGCLFLQMDTGGREREKERERERECAPEREREREKEREGMPHYIESHWEREEREGMPHYIESHLWKYVLE